MTEGNIWALVLEQLQAELDPEEFRRWFANSSYASDSGDQITVWVAAANEARHLSQNYTDRLHRALVSLGRADTMVRFLATGYTDEEDAEDREE